MTGALMLAAGVPEAFEHGDWTVVTAGYVVMRIVMIAQWLRAARRIRQRRAHGAPVRCWASASSRSRWVGLPSSLPDLVRFGFGVPLVLLELLVPIWSERAATTSWHPHHIAERYGLLTIIVLGESVLAATSGIQAALAAGESASGCYR